MTAPHDTGAPSTPSLPSILWRAFDAFGPDRVLWGGIGNTMEEFDRQVRLFDVMFDFASEADRAKIRGLNAMKLFRF